MAEGFKALGISEKTLKALEKKGFVNPSPIQEKVIPILLAGDKDVIGQAQTGTGKTAAFSIPLIEKLQENAPHLQALVLTPTRELALQVCTEIVSLKGNENRLRVDAFYGGQSINEQINKLRRGVDIAVGTPGRILDLIERKFLKLQHVSYVVLDEADEMLNMGFLEDVENILEEVQGNKQMLLFSATMPDRIKQIANRFMKTPEFISVKKEQLTTEMVQQTYYAVPYKSRFEALCRIIDTEDLFYGLIFCNTKAETDDVTRWLLERNYEADALHGDIAQQQREKILKRFKARQIKILVATDVAARGIDVNDLTHVINLGLPQDPESYVHRIGRTGRAGKEGKAISIVDRDGLGKIKFIQKIAKCEIKRASLPPVEELAELKKNKILHELDSLLDHELGDQYVQMAYKLLAQNEPDQLVAALLKKAYSYDLDVKNFEHIAELKTDTSTSTRFGRERGERSSSGSGSSSSSKGSERSTGERRTRSTDRGEDYGKTRLFFAQGKANSMSPQKLLKFFNDEFPGEFIKIDDIRILENFSFLSVEPDDAEMILKHFGKKSKGGKKSMISKAKS
jgi:ATP-dependent RNA helicase DeaD